MRRYCWILFLMGMANGAAAADSAASLDGDLVISKEPLTDPLPDGDPVAYMTIRGKDAKQIYAGIKSQDYQNACGVDGMTARVAGNLIWARSKTNCNTLERLRCWDGKNRKAVQAIES